MSKTRDEDLRLKTQEQFSVDVVSGVFTVIFCSMLFNPWDSALYLSVKHNRPFLSMKNFTAPYHGFSPAVVQRAFLSSSYYIIQGESKSHLYPYLHNQIGMSEPLTQFCIGLFAGSASALTNSISAVKTHSWGQENPSFFASAREMWSLGGFKPFIRGTTATAGRDMVFGSTYEVLRNLLRNSLTKAQGKTPIIKEQQVEWISNATAASVAITASSLLNYARNIQYGTAPDAKPPTILRILRNMWSESKNHSQQSLGRIRFFQRQLRIGWGTARATAGMAVGQKVFDWTRSQFSNLHADTPKNTVKK